MDSVHFECADKFKPNINKMKKEEISFEHGGKIRDVGDMLAEMGLAKSEQVHRHLLTGKSLSVEQFAEMLEKSTSEGKEILSLHGEVDANHVVGFLGLSLRKTNHKMKFNGKTIYTWCAADTLMFPQYLSFSAQIESKDPITSDLVKLSVNENFLDWTNPVPLYISWMKMADSCDIRQSFCNHSSFFSAKESADKWLQENPGGKISLVEEFFQYAHGTRCC